VAYFFWVTLLIRYREIAKIGHIGDHWPDRVASVEVELKGSSKW